MCHAYWLAVVLISVVGTLITDNLVNNLGVRLQTTTIALGDVHTWAKPVFIVLICIHAGAALFHHFILKDAVLRRMLVPARDPVG
ncbi:hypothetical protein X770_10755 [Mesorhizobium sp. LSJC269B00]|nr:hypothetical protein X770_10755 [Mesorhizobium sp. LSJC269B00]